MGTVVRTLLGVWMILDSGFGSVSLPEITDRRFIEECVREHNKARSSVRPPASDMLYMTWDEGLAITARAWARRCEFEHNIHLKDVRRVHPTFSSVGENIWVGYPPTQFDVTKAVKRWVDEKNDYDYNSNTCSSRCGHYTQVVWASSYKVGCAVQLCSSGVKHAYESEESAIFVCNYATAGNYVGVKPYKQGASCSGCKETCEQNLCRSPERDAQKSYKWAPDWDSAPAAPAAPATPTNSGFSSYGTVLVTRPIGLIFTFITAVIVRHFYPDVFCYE